MFDSDIVDDSPDDVSFPVPIVSQKNEEALTEFPPLMAEDYEDFKRNLMGFWAVRGKDPLRGRGYSDHTVRASHYKIEQVFRWLWEHEGYTTDLTYDQATELIGQLVSHQEYDDDRVLDYEKAIKRLFTYYEETTGRTGEWDHGYQLSQEPPDKNLDYFKKHELGKLYDASLEVGSVRAYHSVSRKERDRIAAYLAQRFEKPKREIGPDDWDRANSWKFPSLVAVCLDAGLRPVEVERSRVSWFNFEDNELVIPKEQSAKDKAPWECALSNRTVTVAKKWLRERETYEKYEDSDAVWLTKYGSPYETNSLNRLLNNKLLPETKIKPRGRHLSWYSIRRGVATVWANEEGIHDAKEQLRHKKIETTLRYVYSNSKRRAEQANTKW